MHFFITFFSAVCQTHSVQCFQVAAQQAKRYINPVWTSMVFCRLKHDWLTSSNLVGFVLVHEVPKDQWASPWPFPVLWNCLVCAMISRSPCDKEVNNLLSAILSAIYRSIASLHTNYGDLKKKKVWLPLCFVQPCNSLALRSPKSAFWIKIRIIFFVTHPSQQSAWFHIAWFVCWTLHCRFECVI